MQTQTQEAVSSGAEVDENAITRRVLSERPDHEKGVGHRLKGINSFASSTTGSHATCAPGCSSSGPTYKEFAAIQAQCTAVQAESQRYWQFAAM